MRSAKADDYEDVPRDVVAIGNDYPRGHVVTAHRHKRAQLIYAATGVMTVTTAEGSWVVPPQRAVWIPSGIIHEVRMSGDVTTRSIYVRTEAANATGLPTLCRVVGVSTLLRALLLEAVDLPTLYALDSRAARIMALLLDEIRAMPTLALRTPLPQDERLVRLCHALLDAPMRDVPIDNAAQRVGMSRRSFTRLFRAQTGMSFASWRQQACLVAALARLAQGEAITTVAMDLGYNNPSAFSAVFRRVLGVAPSRYFDAGNDAGSNA
jgi:AraC-like DNA-binding protein/mannose-6-phosphate isomerase-like protein (cupin superfamily)